MFFHLHFSVLAFKHFKFVPVNASIWMKFNSLDKYFDEPNTVHDNYQTSSSGNEKISDSLGVCTIYTLVFGLFIKSIVTTHVEIIINRINCCLDLENVPEVRTMSEVCCLITSISSDCSQSHHWAINRTQVNWQWI